MTCHDCNGENVIDAPDLKRWPKDLSKLWRDTEREIAECIAEQRAEIAMGA